MKILRSFCFIFLFLFGVIRNNVQANNSTKSTSNSSSPGTLADDIPTLEITIELAKLSSLVYKFRYSQNFTCDTVNNDKRNDFDCLWYLHDVELGTQVLLVSNHNQKYVAIAFAGTDDVRTSLEDADIFTQPFGGGYNSTIQLPNSTTTATSERNNIRVHAGFDNAIFTRNIWQQIYNQTMWLLEQYPSYDLYTTGHSLGAANAIFTATAFASIQRHQQQRRQYPPVLVKKVRSINFGCPRTGNYNWRTYFNASSPLRDNLGIWRVVLGWDVVARLPQLFYHVGHTIQIDGDTNETRIYYEHYGDKDRGLASVPLGWYARTYAWLPSSLIIHHIKQYLEHLQALYDANISWPTNFVLTTTDATLAYG